jgi:hypothetical protein
MLAGMIAMSQPAAATVLPACLASPQCTLDGQTFTTTGGTSGNGLTFIANFSTPNQSNSTIATLVTDYLGLSGYNVTYLGRQDGTGLAPGVLSISTTSSDGELTGNWSLDAGTTGYVGSFVAIHAGGGQSDNLFSIDSPGLSGTWGTNNGKGLSNFDLFSSKQTSVPEPGSLGLLGAGLMVLSLLALRRRRC